MGYINNQENKLHYAYSAQRWKTHITYNNSLRLVQCWRPSARAWAPATPMLLSIRLHVNSNTYMYLLVNHTVMVQIFVIYFAVHFCVCEIKKLRKFEHLNFSQCYKTRCEPWPTQHAANNLSLYSVKYINQLVSPLIIIEVKKAHIKADERSSSSTACHVLVSEVHGRGLAALSYEIETYDVYGVFGLIYENLHQRKFPAIW